MSDAAITTAAAIKQARQALGLTQEKLARVLKVSFPTVNRWENGKTQPDKRARHALADLIRVKAPDRASLADQIDGGRREPADGASVKPRKTQGRSRSKEGGARSKRVKPPRPPITPADPLLPIADGEFLWQQFETFAEDYVKALTGAKVSRYGTRGEDQKGIDFYADEVDGRATYQCRQWKKFTKADAKAAIAETTYEGAARHVVLVTCEVGTGVRDIFEAAEGWEIRDIRDMSRDVSIGMSLGVAKRLLDKNFGGPWRRNFLKIDGLSTFLDAERFFGALLDSDDLLSHTAEQVGRDEAMVALAQFHASPVRQIAIISGRGGIGKSRLLAAYADAYPASEIRFVERGVTVTPTSVDELPLADKIVIVVDDAHQRDDLGALLAFQRQRSGTKLVLVTRSHGLEGLKAKVAEATVDPKRIIEVPPLLDLERSATRQLVQSILPEADDEVIARIASVARDSPLVAVVASRLLLRRELDLGALSRDEDVRQAVLRRFRDEQLGRVTVFPPDIVQKFSRVAAAIGPFRATQNEVGVAVGKFLGLAGNDYMKLLESAERSGLLLRRGYLYRLTPDVLADYLLDDACLTNTGASTGFAEQMFDEFGAVAGALLLRNLGEAEWRTNRASEEAVNILGIVWDKIDSEFRSAGILQRSLLLEMITEVAPYQPERAIALAERALTRPVDTRTEWDEAWHFTEETVLRHVPGVLRRVALNLEYLPRAADLLWRIGRDKPGRLESLTGHPVRILQDIISFEVRKPTEYRTALLERLERWSEEPDAHTHVHSVLDIVDKLLERQGTHSVSEGFSLVLQPFFVNAAATRSLRERALSVVQKAAATSDSRVVLRAIKSYSAVLHDYGSAPFGAPLPDDWGDRWRPERLAALDALASIARRATEPILQLEVLAAVQWYAFKESDRSVREAAARVLAAIPGSPDRLLAEMVIDANGWKYRLDADDGDDRLRLWERTMQGRRREVAVTTCARLTPESFLDAVDERLVTSRSHGLDPSPYLFFSAMVDVAPDFVTTVCRLLIDQPSRPLAGYLHSFLIRLAEIARPISIELLEAAVATGNTTLTRGAAATFVFERALQPREEAILRGALAAKDEATRVNAIWSLGTLADTNHAFALESISAIAIRGSLPIALAVAQFCQRTSGLFEALPNDVLERFVRECVDLQNLEDYHLGQMLSAAARRVPRAVVRLLLDRIARGHDERREDFEALPFNRIPVKKEELVLASDYEVILKDVVAALRPKTWQRQEWVPRVFRTIASLREPRVLNALDDLVSSGEPERLEDVAQLLSKAPASFVFDEPMFVSKLLEAATSAGDQVEKKVHRELLDPLVTQMRTGSGGQPFPQDVAFRDQAVNAAQRFQVGSPTERFYRDIEKYARGQIKDKLLRDEEIEDE